MKEIAAEARQRGFKPIPSDKIKEGLPPTRQKKTLRHLIPEGADRRNISPLQIETMFFTWETDLWAVIAISTNEKIAAKIELKQKHTFRAHVSAAEVKTVWFLRLRLCLLRGHSLEDTYKQLHLEKCMSWARFAFISANATVNPDRICAVIRCCSCLVCSCIPLLI